MYFFYFDLIFHHSTSIWGWCAIIKTQRRDRVLNRGDKTKRKVWKDIDEVVKASIVPKKLKWYEREMLVVPKGEKSK